MFAHVGRTCLCSETEKLTDRQALEAKLQEIARAARQAELEARRQVFATSCFSL